MTARQAASVRSSHDRVLASASAAVAGLLFGAGLGVSGMARPEKVLAFLDVTGAFDPSLALVMVGAIGGHAILLRLILLLRGPLFEPRFDLPVSRSIDRRLVTGAAVFGVGWGLAGYCPGPALLDLATGRPGPVIFVASMLTGMWLEQTLRDRRQRAAG